MRCDSLIQKMRAFYVVVSGKLLSSKRQPGIQAAARSWRQNCLGEGTLRLLTASLETCMLLLYKLANLVAIHPSRVNGSTRDAMRPLG